MSEIMTIFLIVWFILSWIFILANHIEIVELTKLAKDMGKEINKLKEGE